MLKIYSPKIDKEEEEEDVDIIINDVYTVIASKNFLLISQQK